MPNTSNVNINKDTDNNVQVPNVKGVIGPKPSFVKENTPKQPLISSLHRTSHSYFPYPQSRVSFNSNKSSELSGCVEDSKYGGESTRASDPSLYMPSPLKRCDSILGSDFPSFYIDEGEDQKFTYNSKKIFVGGLPHGLTESEFRQYFSKYGEIED